MSNRFAAPDLRSVRSVTHRSNPLFSSYPPRFGLHLVLSERAGFVFEN
jgi:hypothetical protein